MDATAKSPLPHAEESEMLGIPRIRHVPENQPALDPLTEGHTTLDPHRQQILVEEAGVDVGDHHVLGGDPRAPGGRGHPLRVRWVERSMIFTPVAGHVSARAAVSHVPT